MDERDLRGLINRVRKGRLSRRGFVRRMLAVGLTAPMATQLLAVGGVAMAQPASKYTPTKAGGGGTLKVLWWQGPTLLNPHFATGTKDQDGSRLFSVYHSADGVKFYVITEGDRSATTVLLPEDY